jgi:hypothetical protein
MEATGTRVGDDPAGIADRELAASLAGLARDSSGYARALGQLVAGEAELAKTNLTRLLVVALLAPAIAAGSVMTLDAMLAALLMRWLHAWTWAIGIVAAANVALLLTSLWLLRTWWRSLSLPRSRAALGRLWVQS